MNEVYAFDYPFPREQLLHEWHSFHEQHSSGYIDNRMAEPVDWWRISKAKDHPVAKQFCDTLGIQGNSKFYILRAGTTLPWHVDNGTQCAVNVILNTGEHAPVSFRDSGNAYTYSIALLNTSLTHAVFNVANDRILFKISFLDYSFAQVRERIHRI